MRVVIDTNVLVSAFRSNLGASFRLVHKLGRSVFTPIVSTTLFLEHEDVLKRPGLLPAVTTEDIDDFLDYFLTESIECKIHFHWRPFLPDPGDDMLLELAVAGAAEFIITHNERHFSGCETFGIRAVTPAEFLRILKTT